MIMRRLATSRILRLFIPGGSLLLLGECGFSDQQLSLIAQSAITTGLNTVVSQTLINLLDAAGTAGG